MFMSCDFLLSEPENDEEGYEKLFSKMMREIKGILIHSCKVIFVFKITANNNSESRTWATH